MTPERAPVVLGRRARAARSAGVAAVLAVLVVGQVQDTNDLFPFGSLSQYATARSLDGDVRSVFLAADTVDGEEVRVPLDQDTVGVGRAEVENQLDRLVDDPSLLQALADARAALRPDAPALRELRLMRSTRELRDGYVVGEPEVEELASWVVRPGDGS